MPCGNPSRCVDNSERPNCIWYSLPTGRNPHALYHETWDRRYRFAPSLSMGSQTSILDFECVLTRVFECCIKEIAVCSGFLSGCTMGCQGWMTPNSGHSMNTTIKPTNSSFVSSYASITTLLCFARSSSNCSLIPSSVRSSRRSADLCRAANANSAAFRKSISLISRVVILNHVAPSSEHATSVDENRLHPSAAQTGFGFQFYHLPTQQLHSRYASRFA